MRQMALATGRKFAASKYLRMEKEARKYIREKFFNESGKFRLAQLNTMQTPALFALKLDLVEGEAKARMIAALKKNIADHGDCLQTGFLGTSILMDTLTENGMVDVAYTLLLQHKNPSWLYSVDQGATTIWERWNSYVKATGFGPVGMNSFNHYAYGAVLAWIYKTAAGIAADPDAPGFKNIVMSPKPDRRLGSVKAVYKTPHGIVKSAWRYDGDMWIWNFTVPAGATATVTSPVPDAKAVAYKPGSYEIKCRLP
jgi:alpha-L-rhamnosidase